MADSFISIPNPTGSPDPYKVDSRTVNTDEHRQVVVIGDPTTNANVAAVNASGEIAVASHAVTNAGTFAVQAAQSTAANLNARVQGADASAAVVTGRPVAIAGIFDDEGDVVVPLRTSDATNGILKVQVYNPGLSVIATGVEAVGAVAANAPVVVGFVDAAGNVQYARSYIEGDADASITGTAIMWEDTSDTLHAVSAAKPLPISVATLPALVAGTANIGDVDVLTLPALPTGANVIGAVTQSGTWNVGTVTAVTAISNALPAGTNAIGKLAANSGVDIGDVDVTSVGGNVTVVQGTAANLKVDPSAVTSPVSVAFGVASAATLSSVADTASSASLLASNAARKGAMFYNDSDQDLYLKYGATASLTSFTVKIPALGFWEMPNAPIFTGAVDGIWAANSTGSARITEL